MATRVTIRKELKEEAQSLGLDGKDLIDYINCEYDKIIAREEKERERERVEKEKAKEREREENQRLKDRELAETEKQLEREREEQERAYELERLRLESIERDKQRAHDIAMAAQNPRLHPEESRSNSPDPSISSIPPSSLFFPLEPYNESQ